MISFIIVISISFLPSEFPPSTVLAELFHLSKEYLKRRMFRFILLLSSLSIFSAGITALSLILPFYAVFVPFLIVICVFAVAMLSSVYERKKDIFSLTSAGLNPDEIQGLFLLEAAFIGFLGGGIGYALGLSLIIFGSLPIHKIELSTGWVVVALLVSIAAALMASIYPSIKASLLTTPSLIRRWWKISRLYKGWPPEWTLELPVKVLRDQIESFMRYFHDYALWLERLPPTYLENARNIHFYSNRFPNGEEVWTLKFDYMFGVGSPPVIMTHNEIKAVRKAESEGFTVRLSVKVISHHDINVYRALKRIISTYRQMVLDWTEKATFKTKRERISTQETLLF
ncbi:TPA: FtsX-like permease family protein [Candidatus Bathyarchaeota archaeon]|nr:FtsX-like permease family protein [Candidatus Bathyarchaeota archaeon]